MNKVIAIMGPTASGKTQAAMALADRYSTVDLISVDSAMVYRGMDIGTAKPSPAELERWPHGLVDIAEPEDSFSAARFVQSADALVASSLASQRIPVLVGGTMLYFNAFKKGLNDLPSADPAVRAAIAARAEREGWPALHRELARIDPVAAARIEPQNRQRVQRALEVFELTGRPISAFWGDESVGFAARFDAELIECAIVPPDRRALHERIARRIDEMLARGLIDEVRALRERGVLSLEHPSMRAVGYRQVWQHLDGCYDAEEMVRRVNAATRQLAKKQLTWLRRWPGVVALESPVAAGDWLARCIEDADDP